MCESVKETSLAGACCGDIKMKLEKICISPGVVPAVRLDEVHVSVFGQEGHQLVIGPEMEEKD